MTQEQTEGGNVRLSAGLEPFSTQFRFDEFNPRRAARGAEAARVTVIEDGEEAWLWMSKRDIAKNMMVYGRHPELVKAHAAYGSNTRDEGPRAHEEISDE